MKTLTILLGSNGYLGSALLKRMQGEGFSVIGVDKHEHNTSPYSCSYLQCDLLDNNQISRATQNISLAGYERVIIASTIGIFGEPSFTSASNRFDIERFRLSVQVNLVGVCSLICSLLMKRSTPKTNIRIVMVGSAAAHAGSCDLGYGVSKAGLNGFVRSTSKLLAQEGVTCIGINPGIFDSPMSKSVSEQRQLAAIQATHIKRVGKIDEIADYIMYLLYNAPDYLTGSIIQFNGGQYS